MASWYLPYLPVYNTNEEFGVLHVLGLGRQRNLLVYAFEGRVTESMKAAFTEKTPI